MKGFLRNDTTRDNDYTTTYIYYIDLRISVTDVQVEYVNKMNQNINELVLFKLIVDHQKQFSNL